EIVAACAPTGDFAPAQEVGAKVNQTRSRIAELEAQLIAAQTAEDRRLAEALLKEQRAAVRNGRARLGEARRAREGYWSCLRDAADWRRRELDALNVVHTILREAGINDHMLGEFPSVKFWRVEGLVTPDPEPSPAHVADIAELDDFIKSS